MIESFKQLEANEVHIKLDDLDKSQMAAVKTDASNVLLRAPAGSGKTLSLINAIASYRYENLNDRICAITYTRAARAEMEKRLADKGIYDVEITTIHVWSRNLLEYYAIKYGFKVRVMQEMEIKSILEEIVQEHLKHSKVKNVNIGILYSFITGNKNMDVSDNYKRTLVSLENKYIKYKRDNFLYDFTDYPLYLYNVLNTFDEVITGIDALFVDEYQDVDEIQFEIFKKVQAKKKFYVGDPWQSIFQFRGADGMVFNKLEDFSPFQLVYNYRSYQKIIDYASTVYKELYRSAAEENMCYITSVMHKEDSSITCARGDGGSITIINPFGRNIQFKDDTESRIDTLETFKTFMMSRPQILCRTNKQVKYINDLGYFECSTIHQAKGLEYDNVLVIDTTINCMEDLNIAYVALTRAKDNLFVINWQQFEMLFDMYMR